MRQAVVIVVAAGLSAASCGEKGPDLARSAWKALEVEYCLPSGETKTWGSTDPAELETLRRAMAPGEPRSLGVRAFSYTNEIRLELASGQKWKLYYRDSARQLTFHDPDATTHSFVVSVSEELYSGIGASLVAAGGGPISLRGDCRLARMKGR